MLCLMRESLDFREDVRWWNPSRVMDWLLPQALQEDASEYDITSWMAVGKKEEKKGTMDIIAETSCYVAGLWVTARILEHLAPGQCQIHYHVREGDHVHPGTPVLSLTGPAYVLLAGERLMLNWLSLLSSVATRTARLVQAFEDVSRRISCPIRWVVQDTRKTLPLYRALLRWAVRIGGGRNHRFSLASAILWKDNHHVLFFQNHPTTLEEWMNHLKQMHTAEADLRLRPWEIYIEVENYEQLQAVANSLRSHPEWTNPSTGLWIRRIMLDNFPSDTLGDALSQLPPSVEAEITGGIEPARVPAIVSSVKNGVHDRPVIYVSSGWLTRTCGEEAQFTAIMNL